MTRPSRRHAPCRCRCRPRSSASDRAADGSAASRGRPPLPAAVLLRVGSRGSRLALTQAERAASLLRAPGVEIALVPITTAGDRDRTRPFGEIGARGVFVKELEEALLEDRIDVAVHSAKDMTSTDTEGLVVGAYTEREDPRDALCGASCDRAGDADRDGVGATSRPAPRARADASRSSRCAGTSTRVCASAASAGLDAIVLAACGLDRLGLGGRDRSAARPGDDAARRRGRARSRCRSGPARSTSSRPRTTRRRVAASRPSVAASPSSAAAASRRSPRSTTASGWSGLIAAEDGSVGRARRRGRSRRGRRASSPPASRDARATRRPRASHRSARSRHGSRASARLPFGVPVGGRGLGTGRGRSARDGTRRRHATGRAGGRAASTRLRAVGHDVEPRAADRGRAARRRSDRRLAATTGS